MKNHPATKLFPLLTDEEFAALCDDIRKNGQQEPIVLLNGRVIDGRNRLRACQKIGIKPKTRNAKGNPFDLVMSLNYHRRHLRPHEKGEALRQYLEAKGGKAGQNKGGRPSKNGKPRHSGAVSVRDVAKELGVPEATARKQIKAAETYADLPKALQEKVDSGECPIELAPRVSAAVDKQLQTMKVSKAKKAEVEKILNETSELQRKIFGAMKWLQSIESACRFYEEFLLSRRWTKSEKQIIERVCKRLSAFIRQMKKLK